MSINPNQHFPSPAPTPDQSRDQYSSHHLAQSGQGTIRGLPAMEGQGYPPHQNGLEYIEGGELRAQVEQNLLRLIQDLYEMEICAGDVGMGMEGAVPNYLAKINESFVTLSRMAEEMREIESETVPKAVIQAVDEGRNPHIQTRNMLVNAATENQYTLGRMVGLETFRRELAEALSSEFPTIPIPERRHRPPSSTGHEREALRVASGISREELKEEHHGGDEYRFREYDEGGLRNGHDVASAEAGIPTGEVKIE